MFVNLEHGTWHPTMHPGGARALNVHTLPRRREKVFVLVPQIIQMMPPTKVTFLNTTKKVASWGPRTAFGWILGGYLVPPQGIRNSTKLDLGPCPMSLY